MRTMKLLLSSVLFLAPIAGFGQTLGFGPQLGIYKASDADEAELMVGGTVRLALSPALKIEGSINYRREKYDDGGITVKSWPVMATALFYPFPILYGAGGFGWYNTRTDYDPIKFGSDFLVREADKSQKVGWHFGGGLELPFGSSSRLFGDIRYVFIDYEFRDLPGSKDLQSDFYVITLGLLLGI